ncbi:MAG: DNA-binding response regulator, partial [Acidobacteria bacterium]
MEIISLRLLIAEDYELFRNLYRAIIEPRSELQIVAEA